MTADIILNTRRHDVVATKINGMPDRTGQYCLFSAIQNSKRITVSLDIQTCEVHQSGIFYDALALPSIENWNFLDWYFYSITNLYYLKNISGCIQRQIKNSNPFFISMFCLNKRYTFFCL